MRYTYVVQTNIPIREVREKLQLISPSTSVHHSIEVLFLDVMNSDVLMLSAGGSEKGNILPVAHQNIDFYLLREGRCPRCGSKLTAEGYSYGECTCGFSWNHSAMWMEDAKEEEEEESPGT